MMKRIKVDRYAAFYKPYYDVYDAGNDVYHVQCYHSNHMGFRTKIDAGTLQVGAMTAFITYAMQIVMAFLMMTAMSIMVPRAGVAADRIDEVLKTEASVQDVKKPETLKEHKGVLEFSHVDFKYPGAEHNVLSDIDFKVEPGKITAIIGSTAVESLRWLI